MSQPDSWEREVLEKIAMQALQEQRKSRNWNIFFKSLTFIFLFLLLFKFLGWFNKVDVHHGKHTALVDLHGVISANSDASADNIIHGLDAAFKNKNTKGVVLRINSPGGSPVQASYINKEIWRLRAKYPNIPIYAVVEDICASGGYYVAVATDKIFVNPSSLVGSIGVLMDGFGFTGTLQKLGIERRLLTAGKNKGFLDPFSPMEPAQKQYALSMLEEIHQNFINAVRRGRGSRLKVNKNTFSGLVWTGAKSIQLGLADAVGSTDYVARRIIKADRIVNYTPHQGWAERFARRFGAAATERVYTLVRSAGLQLY
ncbi:MAG TPA: S49 family peptidase [Betaproteobacteria bacterium]|nr:S49 family peptidase [Betaproteobacteria bacterium]